MRTDETSDRPGGAVGDDAARSGNTHAEAADTGAKKRVTPARGRAGPAARGPLVPEINVRVAGMLAKGAELLERQGAEGFRERAYRAAAKTVGALTRPVDEILAREGRSGLVTLPTIGIGIAGAIAEIVLSGRWSRLDRLRGEHDPERLFLAVPGIGEVLAMRFVDELGLETLDELERFLRSPGSSVRGLGPRRRESILATLAARLGHPPPEAAPPPTPSEALVLTIDAAYRVGAASDALPRVVADSPTPVPFELVPVLHRHADGWDFTAMYSPPPRTRRPEQSAECVAIHFQRDGELEGRCLVYSEHPGGETVRRVVFGPSCRTA